MAKHIKTNKIKKRKAAKKTLRKTKRIRQKGKKQSGGFFNPFETKAQKEWKKFINSPDEQVKMKQNKANTQCNKIINATFNPYESNPYESNISNIQSKLHGKEAVAKTIVTDAKQYWNNALNGNDDEKKKYRPYFGRSANMFNSSNPLIKICITEKHIEGAPMLQGDNGIDNDVILIPFEEKYQFKKYQSKSQSQQKNTVKNSIDPFKEFENDIRQKYNYNNKSVPKFEDKENYYIEDNDNFCFKTYSNIKFQDDNYKNNKYFIIFEPKGNTNHIYKSLDELPANQIDEFVEITGKNIKVLRKKPWPIDSCN